MAPPARPADIHTRSHRIVAAAGVTTPSTGHTHRRHNAALSILETLAGLDEHHHRTDIDRQGSWEHRDHRGLWPPCGEPSALHPLRLFSVSPIFTSVAIKPEALGPMPVTPDQRRNRSYLVPPVRAEGETSPPSFFGPTYHYQLGYLANSAGQAIYKPCAGVPGSTAKPAPPGFTGAEPSPPSFSHMPDSYQSGYLCIYPVKPGEAR